MVALLPGSLLHGIAYPWRTRRQRLAMVESLGGDLAGMIDAHEPRGVAPLGRREFCFRQRTSGVVAALSDATVR